MDPLSKALMFLSSGTLMIGCCGCYVAIRLSANDWVIGFLVIAVSSTPFLLLAAYLGKGDEGQN